MKKWAIALSALCLASALPASRVEAQDRCDEVCGPTVRCGTSCTRCWIETIDQGCLYAFWTTCGRTGFACDGRIGYGQAGNIFDGEYCDNLVPHNVDPTPPNYPKAADGEFSCWFNSPDVICYDQPPLYGYINVRKCYTTPSGLKIDYGCGDCIIE